MGKHVTRLIHQWYLVHDASHGTFLLSKYRAHAKPHHGQSEGLRVPHAQTQPMMAQLCQPKKGGGAQFTCKNRSTSTYLSSPPDSAWRGSELTRTVSAHRELMRTHVNVLPRGHDAGAERKRSPYRSRKKRRKSSSRAKEGLFWSPVDFLVNPRDWK